MNNSKGRTNTTRERKERKAEQLRMWADGRDQKADAALAGVHAITDRIPFGQPILVGHHSERGARADQRRIESGMNRFSENMGKAAEMRSRANGIEAQNSRAIYSDDHDAVDQLAARIAKLEAQRETVKARNAEFKRAHAVELKAESSAYARDRMMPFPSYVLKNLSADIRRNRLRLEELQRAETPRRLTARYPGECRGCGATIERGEECNYYRRSRELEHLGCQS